MDLMEVPSHITAPKGIQLKPSEVDPSQMGAWSTVFIPKGSVYGPFVGEVVYEHNDKKVDYRFAWEVYNLDTSELLHIVNATDAKKGNWMRYVNCARYLEEQNFVSVQEGLKVFYKAIKDVNPGEELLTWFEPFKKKRRRRKKNLVDGTSSQESTPQDKKADKKQVSKPPTPQPTSTAQPPSSKSIIGEPEILDRSKRQRKKKKLFDEEILLTDLVFKKSRHRRTREEIERDELEAKLNPKVKVRKRRKKNSTESVQTKKSSDEGMKTVVTEERADGDEYDNPGGIQGSLDGLEEVDGNSAESLEKNWSYPSKKYEYQFDMQSHFGSHISQNGRRMYKCDVCSGIYRHTFSLKRHYLRNHVNCKYLSRTDIANCMIVIGQQQLAILKSNSKNTLQRVDKALCDEDEKIDTKDKHSTREIKVEPKTPEKEQEVGNSSVDLGAEKPVVSEKDPNSLDWIKKEIPEDDTEKMDDIENDKTERVNKPMSMPGLYKCNICYKLFDVVDKLKSHTQDHPPVPDVKGFACDKCHMRFTYKQNLVRHHLVHEKEEPQKKEDKKKGQAKKGPAPTPTLRDLDGKPIVHKPFRCSKCPMRFRYQVNLDRHEAIHDADRPFICSYCGKAFPTATNMKKHEHVHLGSKVPCKYCTAIFVHVGSLRKHIRLEHPDIHRQRLLKLLEKRGKLGTKAAKSLQESYNQDKINTNSTPVIEINMQEPVKKEKKKVRKTQKEEIDTKFKFACVICKKRFTAYVNMCRHRRLAHKEEKVEPKQKEAQSPVKTPVKTFSVKSLINIQKKDEEPIQFDTANDPIDNSPEATAQFFANVAANIAENLNCYIDGGPESLSKYKDHILIDNFDSSPPDDNEDSSNNHSSDVSWESFNFPKNYNPKSLDDNFVHFSECPVPVKEDKVDNVVDGISFEDRAPALCTRRRSSLEGLSSCESSRDGLETQHSVRIKKEPVTPTKQDGTCRNENSSSGMQEQKCDSLQEILDPKSINLPKNVAVDEKLSVEGCNHSENGGTRLPPQNTGNETDGDNSTKNCEISRTESSGFKVKSDEINESKDHHSESRSSPYILKLPLLFGKAAEPKSDSDETTDTLTVAKSNIHETKDTLTVAKSKSDTDETTDTLTVAKSKSDTDETTDTLTVAKCNIDETSDTLSVAKSSTDGTTDTLVVAKSNINDNSLKSDNVKKCGNLKNLKDTDEKMDSEEKPQEQCIKKDVDLFCSETLKISCEKSDLCEAGNCCDIESMKDVCGTQESSQQDSSEKLDDDKNVKIGCDNKDEILQENEMDKKEKSNCNPENKEENSKNEIEKTENDCVKQGCVDQFEGKDGKNNLTEDVNILSVKSDEKQIKSDSGNENIPKQSESADPEDKNNRVPVLREDFNDLICTEKLEEEEMIKSSLTKVQILTNVSGSGESGLVISDVRSGEEVSKSWFTESHHKYTGSNHDNNDDDEDDNQSGYSSPGVYNPPLSSDSDSDMDAETYQRKLNSEILLQQLHLAKAPLTSSTLNNRDIPESKIPSTEKIYRNLLNLNVPRGEENRPSPKHSPFHEFEAIAFGKHGKPAYVCSVCKKHFVEFESMLRHQLKKHPSLSCHFLEVEEGHEIEYLYYPERRNVGILGASGKALEKTTERCTYTCTRCKGSFKSVDRLRIHIINCAPKPEVTTESASPEKQKRRRRKFPKKILGLDHLQRSYQDVRPKQRSVSTEEDFTGGKIKTKKLFLQTPKRRKTLDSFEIPEDLKPSKVKRKRSYDIGYNPGNHVRRREMTEVLDRHQCKGCGVKFKSISLLERHVKKCDGKEKFKDLKVIKSTVNESFHQKLKHACLYCSRGFAYPKTLMNHYKAFCVVKKEKITMGILSNKEREEEAAMMVRLKQQDDDRNEVITVYDGTEGNRKGWPKGMKRKSRRKNHCWTYIKKRKSSHDGDSPTSGRYTPSNDGDTNSSGRYTPSNDSKSSDRSTPNNDGDVPSIDGVETSTHENFRSSDNQTDREYAVCGKSQGQNKVKVQLINKDSDVVLDKECEKSETSEKETTFKSMKTKNGDQKTDESKSKIQTREVKEKRSQKTVEDKTPVQISENKGQGQTVENKNSSSQVRYIQTVTKSMNGSMLVTIRPVVSGKTATENVGSGTSSLSNIEIPVSGKKTTSSAVISPTQSVVSDKTGSASLNSSKNPPEMFTKINVVPLKSDVNLSVVPKVLKIPKLSTNKSVKPVVKTEIVSNVKSASEDSKKDLKSSAKEKVLKMNVVKDDQNVSEDSLVKFEKKIRGKRKKKERESDVVKKKVQNSTESVSPISASLDPKQSCDNVEKPVKKRKRKKVAKSQSVDNELFKNVPSDAKILDNDAPEVNIVSQNQKNVVSCKDNVAQDKKQTPKKSKTETNNTVKELGPKKTRTPKKKKNASSTGGQTSEIKDNTSSTNGQNAENKGDTSNKSGENNNKKDASSTSGKDAVNKKDTISTSGQNAETKDNSITDVSDKTAVRKTPVKSSPKRKKNKQQTENNMDINIDATCDKPSPKKRRNTQTRKSDQNLENQEDSSISKPNLALEVAVAKESEQYCVMEGDAIIKDTDKKKDKMSPQKKGRKNSVKAETEGGGLVKPSVLHSSVLFQKSITTDVETTVTNDTSLSADKVKCNLNPVFSEDAFSEDAAAVQLLTSLKSADRYPQCNTAKEVNTGRYPQCNTVKEINTVGYPQCNTAKAVKTERYTQCNSVSEVRSPERTGVRASNMAVEDPLSPVSNLLQLAQVAADVLSGVVNSVEEEQTSIIVKQTGVNKNAMSAKYVSDLQRKSESTDSEAEYKVKRTPSKKKRVSKSPVKLTTRAELMTKLDM